MIVYTFWFSASQLITCHLSSLFIHFRGQCLFPLFPNQTSGAGGGLGKGMRRTKGWLGGGTRRTRGWDSWLDRSTRRTIGGGSWQDRGTRRRRRGHDWLSRIRGVGG